MYFLNTNWTVTDLGSNPSLPTDISQSNWGWVCEPASATRVSTGYHRLASQPSVKYLRKQGYHTIHMVWGWPVQKTVCRSWNCCFTLTYSSTHFHFCNMESVYQKQASVSNKMGVKKTELKISVLPPLSSIPQVSLHNERKPLPPPSHPTQTWASINTGLQGIQMSQEILRICLDRKSVV